MFLTRKANICMWAARRAAAVERAMAAGGGGGSAQTGTHSTSGK